MQYKLVTTQIVEINNVVMMSTKEFKEKIKLNNNKIYMTQNEFIYNLQKVTIMNDDTIGGIDLVINEEFFEEIKGLIFSFDLKKFYKVE